MIFSKIRTLIKPAVRISGHRIYGLGAAKTGTHSLAQMFEPYAPSIHEPDQITLIDMVLERERTGDAQPLRELMEWRDRHRPLKVNASQINIYLIGEILLLHPNARFVLTMRHPLDWVRSMLDDSLRRDVVDSWQRFRDFRFGTPARRGGRDDALAQANLYTLKGYFAYWAHAMQAPVDQLEADRLLLVRTEQLHERSGEIAAFCGIDGFEPDEGRAHAFANSDRFGVLGKLDRHHVLDTLEETCGSLLRVYYPEIDPAERLDRIVAKDAPL